MNQKNKILIIDDEIHIAEALRFNLKQQGHEVQVAANGLIGLQMWRDFKPDLIVVDLMMPEVDGHGVIDEIRQNDENLPLLVLSAKDQVKEKVNCLKKGVDDYLAKPFHLDEFLARVERLLVRSNREKNNIKESSAKDKFSFGDVEIDFSLFKGSKNGVEFELTSQELKLLKVFFENPNIVLNREELLLKAWGYGPGIHSRTLDNFIVRFRKYFEDDPKNPKYIKSVRSVGYIFEI